MDRSQFQTLTTMRLQEAQALLDAGHWCGAYYLAGYAVECALKACIHNRNDVGFLFDGERRSFQKDCWTHDLKSLRRHARLEDEFNASALANPSPGTNWGLVKDWSESSRYDDRKGESDARQIMEAIAQEPDGVLSWVKRHW